MSATGAADTGFDFAVASAAIEWRIGGMLKKLNCRVTPLRFFPNSISVFSLLPQLHHAFSLSGVSLLHHFHIFNLVLLLIAYRLPTGMFARTHPDGWLLLAYQMGAAHDRDYADCVFCC